MKGSTLLTLAGITLLITAFYVAMGQPGVTTGYYVRVPVNAENEAESTTTWADQARAALVFWQ